MADDKKKSIFSKILEAGESYLDLQIRKARTLEESTQAPTQKSNDDQSEFYFKSVTEDPSYRINSQGFKEKSTRLMPGFLKQMSLKDSIIAAIIQTQQNQVSNHSRLVDSEQDTGFVIKLKDESAMLRKIKEELESESQIKKSKEIISDQEQEYQTDDKLDGETDDQAEKFNWELERKAREKLEEVIYDRRRKVEQFITNCGEIENRPFETKKWNFDSFLRAIVRDTLTYDLISVELIPDLAGRPHHFFPVDASTIKFAAPSLKKYKSFTASTTNVDLLYPEKHIEAIAKKDVLSLDETLLEEEKYKYVQVINGRIERAFTEDEMKIGIRNVTTDLYNNGYGISELELLVSLISSHLNTEYYNKAYFTQGFSAKGILHLKAPIPTRKLDSIRQQWHHMLKGARNSFQTPIFAGVDEVKWIPLTQNHSDIEFLGWMNYLIKMICAIYQIDPYEIGIGFKDEGSRGGISGDNTEQKLNQSKNKGLYPLLRFIENFVNENIIDMIDSDLELKFTGYDSESKQFSLDRQNKEVAFKKTVNEIRSEDGLPPLPGCDDLILNPVYMQWYTQFSGKQPTISMNQPQAVEAQANSTPSNDQTTEQVQQEDVQDLEDLLSSDMSKSLKIEYYKIK